MVEFAIGALGMTLEVIRSTGRAGSMNCRFKWLEVGRISVLPLGNGGWGIGRALRVRGVFAVLLEWGADGGTKLRHLGRCVARMGVLGAAGGSSALDNEHGVSEPVAIVGAGGVLADAVDDIAGGEPGEAQGATVERVGWNGPDARGFEVAKCPGQLVVGEAIAFDGDRESGLAESGSQGGVFQDDTRAVHSAEPGAGERVQLGFLFERLAESLGGVDPFGKGRLGRLDAAIHEVQVVELVPPEQSTQVVEIAGRTEEDAEIDQESLAQRIRASHGQRRQVHDFLHHVETVDANAPLADERPRQAALILGFVEGTAERVELFVRQAGAVEQVLQAVDGDLLALETREMRSHEGFVGERVRQGEQGLDGGDGGLGVGADGMVGGVGFQQMSAANEVAQMRVGHDGESAEVDGKAAPGRVRRLLEQGQNVVILLEGVRRALHWRGRGRAGPRRRKHGLGLGIVGPTRWAGESGKRLVEQDGAVVDGSDAGIPSIQLSKRHRITFVTDVGNLAGDESVEGQSPQAEECGQTQYSQRDSPGPPIPARNWLLHANAHRLILAPLSAKRKRHRKRTGLLAPLERTSKCPAPVPSRAASWPGFRHRGVVWPQPSAVLDCEPAAANAWYRRPERAQPPCR